MTINRAYKQRDQSGGLSPAYGGDFPAPIPPAETYTFENFDNYTFEDDTDYEFD